MLFTTNDRGFLFNSSNEICNQTSQLKSQQAMEIAVALFASLRQCRALPVARLPPQLLMKWSELLALGLRSNSSKKVQKE